MGVRDIQTGNLSLSNCIELILHEHANLRGKYDPDYMCWAEKGNPLSALSSALSQGNITVYGYFSNEKKLPLRRKWQSQAYKKFSQNLEIIPKECWSYPYPIVCRDWIRTTKGQYNSCQIHELTFRKHFGIEKKEIYRTPYLMLMDMAIEELQISELVQPKVESLVAWFRGYQIGGVRVSLAEAKKMASFVRMPIPKRGGRKKIK